MELLNVKNLTIRTGGQMPLVRGSSFYVQPGETLAIVGESGSGKSLSLLAVLGLLPDELQITGEITFNDLPLHTFSPKQKRRLRGAQIGYISQDPLSNLHPLKSVGRQIEEAILAHQKLSRKALRTRVESLLDEVGIPNASERYLDYPAKFSGGQRQRITIAMAIALRPKLIIADEPTTALDATVQATILQLLKRLQQRYGCALIFISHNLRVVADIADRVAVMQRGKIVEQGSRNLMFSSPSHTYSQALLQAGFPPRATSEFKPSTTPLLEVSQLSRHYSLPSLFRKKNSDLTVLNSVSFTQYKGEIIGLVGESGSGKTTLGRILAGLDGADSGSVTLNGQLWHLPAPCHPQRPTVQMIFQDPYSSVNPRRTVSDILAQPLQIPALREHG